jgi:hypothetical protein
MQGHEYPSGAVGDAGPQRGGREALHGADAARLRRRRPPLLQRRRIYDRWFRLNVVHDVAASTVAVLVDGDERFRTRVIPSTAGPATSSSGCTCSTTTSPRAGSDQRHALHQPLARRMGIHAYICV